jgi:hypothetical protein
MNTLWRGREINMCKLLTLTFFKIFFCIIHLPKAMRGNLKPNAEKKRLKAPNDFPFRISNHNHSIVYYAFAK